MDITAKEYHSSRISPPMDVIATEHYSTWMSPPMYVTATELYSTQHHRRQTSIFGQFRFFC